MKRFTLFYVFLVLVGLSGLQAQNVQITGTITSSEDGSPLPGVSVLVKGTTVGTVSDLDGKYSINVPPNAQSLVFSFLGTKSQEIALTGQNVINVVLEPEAVGLGEVVVVAYGTESKRSVTGAITSLNAEAIGQQIAISPLRALQGSAPGVNVLTTGGQPGVDPTIRIRGIGSVNASQDPLIVVDGVVYNGSLSNISSEQIESINTLKDAAATSLYGSRASNGVIIITTKKGQFNSIASVTLNAKTGFSSPAVKPYDLVGAQDYMKYTWESLKNQNIYSRNMSEAAAGAAASNDLIAQVGYNPFNVANPIDGNGNVVSGAQLLWDTDWYEEMIRDKAVYQDYSAEIRGGSEKISYFFSGNYTKQQGSVIESDFDRFTSRLNLDAKVNKWLNTGITASYSKSNQNYPNQSGSSYTSTMQWVNTIASIYPVYQRDELGNIVNDAAGKPLYDYGNSSGNVNGSRILSGENAIASTLINRIEYKRNSFLGTVYANVILYKGLSFKTTLGYENYTYDSNEYDHYKYGSAATVGGRVSQQRTVTESYTVTNNLKYETDLGKHHIIADAISEVFNYDYDYLVAQGTGFLPDVYVLSGSTTPESVLGYINEERLISYLGRLSYSYAQKYYLLLSYRRDGSTRFSADNRWGNFYSVGANWIISDEGFLKDNSILSFLKFRTSYGELGNNRGIGYFPYLTAFETGWSNGDNPGVILTGISDQDITWEKSGLFNVGLDWGFLKDRISGSIEYYTKKSIDLIFDKPLAPSTGNSIITTNIGSIRNSGWEFSITTKNILTANIEWNTSFNISTNKNNILSLPQEKIIVGTKQLMVDHSIYDFFIQEYIGVDPQTGDALWYTDIIDQEGNVTGRDTTNLYSEATRYYVGGSSLPDYIGGFSSYFRYKNIDLNLLFNYSIGSKIYDSSYQGLMSSLEAPGNQLSQDIEGRWQKPGDVTDIPKLYAANNDYNSQSTRFLFDNDYLRLKSLTLGYQLPKAVSNKMKITDARIYLQADNILTFQSHKGLDPEQDIAGTTNNRSYLMKTYSLGINVTF